MATTYKKVLKALQIKTLAGTTFTAVDTATEAIGSNALAQFEAHETMVIKSGDSEIIYIPFHAVESITVAIGQSENITKPDAVCGD